MYFLLYERFHGCSGEHNDAENLMVCAKELLTCEKDLFVYRKRHESEVSYLLEGL